MGSNALGNCLVCCDLLWYSDLVQCQIGIWCDYRSRGEIAAFSHQIASKAAFLTLQPGPNTFQCLPRLMLMHWLPSYRVIHHRSYIVLQHVFQLGQDSLIRPPLLLLLQLCIHLKNLLIAIRQIIFSPIPAPHSHRGANTGRRDDEVLDDAPFGAGELRIQAKHDAVGVSDG